MEDREVTPPPPNCPVCILLIDRKRVIGCPRDTLNILDSATQRMTAEEIMSALSRQGTPHNETKVKTTLSVMVDLGILDNEPRANPRGYRLLPGVNL